MNPNKKKILMVMPSLPFPVTGAEQSDRANGIKQIIRLGFDVKAIVKLVSWQSFDYAQSIAKELGIEIVPIRYKYSNAEISFKTKIKKFLLKLANPLFFDGAALEYNEPEIKKMVEKIVSNWNPDLITFDYTYLWPLYKIAQKAKIPIIVRSHNFEPRHFLEEEGYGISNFLKFIPKMISEYLTAKNSSLIFSITPKEKKIYKKIGAKNVHNLPLRGLYLCLENFHDTRNKTPLNVFFMGASYNVPHNRKALEFILRDIVPLVKKKSPDKFVFYATGAKLPSEFNKYFNDTDTIYKGFVDDMEGFISDMDIALIPSLFGAGMQQKVFEPLVRGIPTITSARALNGYPFEHGKQLLLADSAEEFADCLIQLENFDLRKELSQNAVKTSRDLFSLEKMDKIVLTELNNLLNYCKK